jgi:hypothetical protein
LGVVGARGGEGHGCPRVGHRAGGCAAHTQIAIERGGGSTGCAGPMGRSGFTRGYSPVAPPGLHGSVRWYRSSPKNLRTANGIHEGLSRGFTGDRVDARGGRGHGFSRVGWPANPQAGVVRTRQSRANDAFTRFARDVRSAWATVLRPSGAGDEWGGSIGSTMTHGLRTLCTSARKSCVFADSVGAQGGWGHWLWRVGRPANPQAGVLRTR